MDFAISIMFTCEILIHYKPIYFQEAFKDNLVPEKDFKKRKKTKKVERRNNIWICMKKQVLCSKSFHDIVS